MSAINLGGDRLACLPEWIPVSRESISFFFFFPYMGRLLRSICDTIVEIGFLTNFELGITLCFWKCRLIKISYSRIWIETENVYFKKIAIWVVIISKLISTRIVKLLAIYLISLYKDFDWNKLLNFIFEINWILF